MITTETNYAIPKNASSHNSQLNQSVPVISFTCPPVASSIWSIHNKLPQRTPHYPRTVSRIKKNNTPRCNSSSLSVPPSVLLMHIHLHKSFIFQIRSQQHKLRRCLLMTALLTRSPRLHPRRRRRRRRVEINDAVPPFPPPFSQTIRNVGDLLDSFLMRCNFSQIRRPKFRKTTPLQHAMEWACS